MLDAFEDGVWFVDLAGVSEGAFIEHTVAAALDLRQQPPASIMQVVSSYLRPRHLLLVLDNCEHVIADCARIADALLADASRLTILATSREPLAIDGEMVWSVPPLSLPEPSDDDNPAEAIEQCEAVRLFLARAAGGRFDVSPDAREPARRRRSVPAARRRAAGDRAGCGAAEGVDGRADSRSARRSVRAAATRQLHGAAAAARARSQRGLELRACWPHPSGSSFSGSQCFPVEGRSSIVEDVCADEGVARHRVLPLLANLVNKSLVTVEDDWSGERRYRYLETIRQYASRRLRESGDAERLGARHLAAHLDLSRGAWNPGWLEAKTGSG